MRSNHSFVQKQNAYKRINFLHVKFFTRDKGQSISLFFLVTNVNTRRGLFPVDSCQSGSKLIYPDTIPAIVDDEILIVS